MMESWMRLPVDSAADEWAGWLWCCGRSHACCPCVCVCMCEVMGSEIVRNTGITGRSGAVRWDGCKTSPSALKSHTHILTQRWRGLSPEAPMLHLRCTGTHMCLDVNARAHFLAIKQMCAYKRACPHTPTSALKLYISYWAALQSAGLMKRYRILQYSSVWGSGEQMARVCNSSNLSSIM